MTDTDELDRLRDEKRQDLLDTDGRSDDVPADPIQVDDVDHFRSVVAAHDVVLVDFYADWCGPCTAIEPTVADVAAETDAVVAKVDVDHHQQLAAEFQVRGVPTLVLFDGGEPAEQLVGLQDKNSLMELVRRHTGS